MGLLLTHFTSIFSHRAQHKVGVRKYLLNWNKTWRVTWTKIIVIPVVVIDQLTVPFHFILVKAMQATHCPPPFDRWANCSWEVELSCAWLQALFSYWSLSLPPLQKSLEVLGRPRPHGCPLSPQIGDLTGYCTSLNHHQMGWAKCNVDHRPRNSNMVDVCPVDRRPMLQRIMETDPLYQGQALASALKSKKKMQKRTGGGTWSPPCIPKGASLGPWLGAPEWATPYGQPQPRFSRQEWVRKLTY